MSEIGQNIKNPLANVYFNSVYKSAAKIAKLRKKDICLDFGCGNQRLKGFLSGQRYIGYDIDPEFSDVSNYRKTRPTIIFALHILEHLTDKEIDDFADWVCAVKPRRVVVSVPCEGFANKFFSAVTGRSYIQGIEHINHWKNIGRLLMKRLTLVDYKRVWMMQWVSAWEVK